MIKFSITILFVCLSCGATEIQNPVHGLASWEQLDEAGHVGAYHIAYDPHKMTCATRRWPVGTILRVTEIHNGISVVVTVTDKNPRGKYLVDLSWRAFGVIAGHQLGRAEVKVEVVNP